ncbi:MAG: PP2C family protein-serine/threonine phosphatase [Thermodesulfobacteriota bacterium]
MPHYPMSCVSSQANTLQAILETSTDGIVVISPEGAIQAVNKAISTIFGYSRQWLLGQPVSVLMPEPYRSTHQSFIQRYLQTGEGHILGVGGREVPGRTSDGSIIPLELGVSEITSGDEHLFAAILRDITERKASQQALMDSYLELENKQKLLDKDLEAAANIQLSLLPHNFPPLPGIDVGWIFKPSLKIGGDIFNLIPMQPQHLGMYILDVSGHGVPAALVAVSAAQAIHRHTSVHSESLPGREELPPPPVTVLEQLDAEFPLERFDTYFTMSYVVMDLESATLHYSNAGHPAPLLIRNSGEVVSLETEGTLIGLGGVRPFTAEQATLHPGDVLVLYTDGIYEQRNPAGTPYGWERMATILRQHRRCSAQHMAAALHESLRTFAETDTFEDDVSLLCVKSLPTAAHRDN